MKPSQPKALIALAVVFAVMMLVWVAPAGADDNGPNPRSDFWRQVRQGSAGYSTSPDAAHHVLIQTQGQLWRTIRNGPLASISPFVLAAVLLALGIFFVIFGRDKLETPRTGTAIPRFNLFERLLHWYTAILFILLALTGLSMLFGRAVLIPVFGLNGFAAYMQVGKYIHNISGPLFLAGVVVEFIVWVKDNRLRAIDFQWFRHLGGLTGGPRPHAGKINGGEKAWFWIMILAALGVGITGILLDFPIWGQSRQTMQIAHIIHVVVAVLFVAASFGHIYIGTLGAEGTFESMWRGKVDAAWAKQHGDLWYEQIKRPGAG